MTRPHTRRDFPSFPARGSYAEASRIAGLLRKEAVGGRGYRADHAAAHGAHSRSTRPVAALDRPHRRRCARRNRIHRVAEHSFGAESAHNDDAKIATMIASVLASVAASVILLARNQRYRRIAEQEAVDSDGDGVPDVYEGHS